MRVTIILSDEAADALLSDQEKSDLAGFAATIAEVLERQGYQLNPIHPRSKDANLRTQFFIDVTDRNAAEAAMSMLMPLPQVRGAYVKPPEALP